MTTTPLPHLAPGDVLVRNAAVGLNPVDWKVLDGSLVDWYQGKVPGVDGAGTVVAVGDDVDQGWLGQRVAYHQDLQKPGSFAAYTPLAAHVLLRMPDAMDFTTAASVPCPALTAWLAIDKLPVKPGKRVLVAGAGGAVGNYLVQLAVARGFEVSTLSHERHHRRLKALGAAHTLHPLNEDALGPCASEDRYFAVVDAISGAHAQRLTGWLAGNGHLVCIQDRLEAPAWPAFGPAISLHEVALGAMHVHGAAAMWAEVVHAGESMLDAIVRGELVPEPCIEGAFARLSDHLEALRSRSTTGKFVVTL